MPKIESPIRHLYLFDDLSFHIKRIGIAQGISVSTLEETLETVWQRLLDSFKCIDHRRTDFNLINWEHACAQLAFELKNRELTYDVMVSQGCNGEYALADLNEQFANSYGCRVTEHATNIRLTHLLEDPSNPFYSAFKIGVSKGAPAEQQIRDVADEIAERFDRRKTRVRVALFDDCIGTGTSAKYLAQRLRHDLEGRAEIALDIVAFVGNESAMYMFQKMGFGTHVGTLFRGKVYPEAWAWDIYFLKDQFLSNALRYTDGTSKSYMAGGWYDKIFAADPERATRMYEEIASLLAKQGILSALEAM